MKKLILTSCFLLIFSSPALAEAQIFLNFRNGLQEKPEPQIPQQKAQKILAKIVTANDKSCADDSNRLSPRIVDYAEGAFTAVNQKEFAYIVNIGDRCGFQGIGTPRLAIFSGENLIATKTLEGAAAIKKISDVNQDGLNEISIEQVVYGFNGNVGIFAEIVDIQQGKLRQVRDFGQVYRTFGRFADVSQIASTILLNTTADKQAVFSQYNYLSDCIPNNQNKCQNADKYLYSGILAFLRYQFEGERLLTEAINYINTQKLTEARVNLLQALNIYDNIIDDPGQVKALTFLGYLANKQRRNQQTVEYLQRLPINNFSLVAGLFQESFFTETSLQQYQKLTGYLQDILKSARQQKNTQLTALTLNALGINAWVVKDYQKSYQYFQQSLRIAQSNKDISQTASLLRMLGHVDIKLEKYTQAIASYQQYLKLGQKDLYPQLDLEFLANAYYLAGNYTKAMEFYRRSLAEEKEPTQRVQGRILANISAAMLATGQLAEAEKTLRKAIAILEVGRTVDDYFNNQDDTVNFTGWAFRPYQLLQQVLLAQNKTAAALEVSESSRARALINILANRVSPLSASPLSIPQIQEIARSHNSTLVEYSIIQDYNSILKGQPQDKELLIWVVTPQGNVSVRRVDLTPIKSSLTDLVILTRRYLGARGRSGEGKSALALINNNTPTINRLQQLHQLLIEPIADLLPKDPNARVTFIPQGALFLLPFPSLQDASGKYLIEKHTIVHAPSIKLLSLTQQQRTKLQQQKTGGALVVGNPTMPSFSPEIGLPAKPLPELKGSEQEAQAVAQLLQTQAITGQQATKVAIIKQLPIARIIHLATHGLFDDVLGGGGAIALAPSKIDNGFLTADEILDLKLNAELVVLSACDTGRGRITPDGVIGLSRSLISAGVPSLVVSLWAVPDEPTALLMTEFYQNLQRNPDKAQALRQAMLTTKQQHPDPINWGAFTLIGESD